MSVIIKSGNSSDLAAVKPASTAPIATDPSLVVTISPNSPAISATVTDGTFEITDGVNGIAAVKPASTAPVTTDKALVVAISPNTPALPVTFSGTTTVVGDGTAGAPAGGVVSVQGVSGGTAQPISASALPLPTGAATSSNQTTLGAQTTELNDGTHSGTIKAASTAPVSTDTALVVAVSPNTPTLPVSLSSSPLPTGAATASNQTTIGTQTTELNDGTHTASIKAASTAPVATDTALVVAVSPNTPTLPVSISATVAVSAASLPLPTGAATAANQTTLGSQTTEINDGTRTGTIKAASTAAVATDTALVVAISPNNTPVLPTGAATSANQTNGSQETQIVQGGNTATVTAASALKVDGSAVTQPVSIAATVAVSATALPLPTGAATSANQTTLGSQTTELNDGTHVGTIKAASTAAVATDTALVVAISPNNTPVLPTGAATAANQATMITDLATIATNTGSAATDFTQTGTITALNGDVEVTGQGVYTVSASITGTWSATLVAQGQLADSTWVAVPMYLVTGALPYQPVFSTTTNGTFLVTGGAYLNIRIIATAYTSGTVDVSLDGSLAQQTIFAGQLGTWLMGIANGGNTANVKAASTAAVAADPSLVVALSPNSTLYDGFGNPVEVKNRIAMPTTQAVSPVSGLDAGTINRVLRVGEHGTVRNTSETLLWHDAIEGTTVNAFWTQSLTTQTVAQTTGVLTLNNSGITTVNTDSILTSQRQFAKIPKGILHWRMRANITANVAANHTLVEMGLGAPAGVTAVVPTGAFYRWTAAGVLNGVISFNGTELVTQLLAQGTISTTSYYRYDIFVEDEFVRFIVTDSNDVPVVDTQVQLTLTNAHVFSVSHLPSFARVYVDATGGGTAIKLNIGTHGVYLLDVVTNKSWQQQMASIMRNAQINPTTFAQTGSALTAAPTTVTPSNTAAAYTTLGGDYAVALTVASENPLSVFAFTIPAPYTFYLTEIQFALPFVTTTIGVTGIPVIEWVAVSNCASADINTGGGQRFPLGINFTYTAATQAAGLFLTSGGNLLWNPDVPIVCLPGTVLHIGYKVFITSAAATPGVTRGSIYVDGYFE
jgi:hypothetical protein